MNLFRLHICTPSGTVFDDEIARFSCRGVSGDFAVMAGHAPLVTYVKEGSCHIVQADGSVRVAHCTGGLITINKDKTCFLPTAFSFQDQ